MTEKILSFATKILKTIMNGDHTEQLPQEGECRNENEGGILESASTFAQRVLEEIEALAGTTACKSVQLVRLKKWAQELGCWYYDNTQFGDFFDRGSENEVYLSPDGMEIIKLNDFRYSNALVSIALSLYLLYVYIAYRHFSIWFFSAMMIWIVGALVIISLGYTGKEIIRRILKRL